MRRLWSALAGTRTPPDGKTENSVRTGARPNHARRASALRQPEEQALVVGVSRALDDVRLPEESIGWLG